MGFFTSFSLNGGWCSSFPCSLKNSLVRYMSAFELCFSFLVTNSSVLLSPSGFLEGFSTNLPPHPLQPRDKNPRAPLHAARLLCFSLILLEKCCDFFAEVIKMGVAEQRRKESWSGRCPQLSLYYGAVRTHQCKTFPSKGVNNTD